MGTAALIFEAMLIGPAGSATANKDDDALADAATLYKVDVKKLRGALHKNTQTTVTVKGRMAKTKG